MENKRSGKSSAEPNPKRPKIESDVPTPSKPEIVDPFLSLPSDIFAKIIGYIPIAQWPSLELVDKNFRATTMIDYRQLRNVNVQRDFLVEHDIVLAVADRLKLTKSIKLILRKLVECSPFLTSIGGIHLRADMVPLLAQFEHLQSILLGDVQYFSQRGIQLENVVHFLESTRSRTSLKELRLYNVGQLQGRWAATIPSIDRFATSFVNGREIQSPLNLVKFSFESSDLFSPLRIRLDTLDASRLTDVRVGKALIEPQQLTNLIGRATNLQRIELCFMSCNGLGVCNSQRLQANKQLLNVLASRAHLTAMKFDTNTWSDKHCMNLGNEFIQMLETIGARGLLRKLVIEENFVSSSGLDVDRVCHTIQTRIPHLESIKVWGLWDGINIDIANLIELKEIYFRNDNYSGVTANTFEKVAHLPRLKQLAIEAFSYDMMDTKSLKYLANAPELMDLRIGNASIINTPVFVRWSDGFARNLQILMLAGVADETESHLNGLIQLLKKTVHLRVLILGGRITDRLLKVIAIWCRELEILGVQTYCNNITVRYLQDIVDRCPRLRKLGGVEDEIWNQLHAPMIRKDVDVDMQFWKYDFDDPEYE